MNEKSTTIVSAQSRPPFIDTKELFYYRELVWAMILRDFKVRYKQTVLGVAWAILHPLTMFAIFSIIFGKLAKIPSDEYPYPIFVFSGLLAWNFFSSSVNTAGMSLVSASILVSKVYFPRIIVPISSIGVSLVDFIISSLLLIGLMLIYSQNISSSILYLPLFLAGLITLSIGFGSWLAAVTVTYRDFRYVITYLLQIGMYVTPVIYPASLIPEKWQWVLYLNPMYAWINGIRACFLGQPIDLISSIPSLLLTVLIFIFGMSYFNKTQRRFADVI